MGLAGVSALESAAAVDEDSLGATPAATGAATGVVAGEAVGVEAGDAAGSDGAGAVTARRLASGPRTALFATAGAGEGAGEDAGSGGRCAAIGVLERERALGTIKVDRAGVLERPRTSVSLARRSRCSDR